MNLPRLPLALCSLALGSCVLAPKVVRDASSGRVTTPDAHTPISGTSVRLRTSALELEGCSSSVLRTIETETDAAGRWQIPRLDTWRLETVLDHEPAGTCQRYDLPGHLDVPPLVTTSDIKRNAYTRGKSAQLSVNETSASGAPRMRVISALLVGTDQLFAFHVGGALLLSEEASMLSLRAVAQPGIRASSLSVGLRAGKGVAGDLSARIVRHGAEPVRMGPELGLDLLVLRLYLGVTGALSGRQRWIPFAGAGIILTQ